MTKIIVNKRMEVRDLTIQLHLSSINWRVNLKIQQIMMINQMPFRHLDLVNLKLRSTLLDRPFAWRVIALEIIPELVCWLAWALEGEKSEWWPFLPSWRGEGWDSVWLKKRGCLEYDDLGLISKSACSKRVGPQLS